MPKVPKVSYHSGQYSPMNRNFSTSRAGQAAFTGVFLCASLCEIVFFFFFSLTIKKFSLRALRTLCENESYVHSNRFQVVVNT